MTGSAVSAERRRAIPAPRVPSPSTESGWRHIVPLDGMRGVAVLAVLFSHLYPESRLPSRLVHCGRLGVVAFFALSGYLITKILLGLRDQRSSPRRALRSFYGRRALRIFPAYLLAIAACWICGYAPVRAHIGWFLTYTVNFGQVQGVNFGFADHFWSLAVEEQFYLVWPALVLAVPERWLRRTILGLVAIAFGLNLIFACLGASYITCFRLPFLGSLIPLALGALLAQADWSEGHAETRLWLRRSFWMAGFPLLVATQALWFRGEARTSWLYLGFVDVAFSLVSIVTLMALTGRTEARHKLLPRLFSWRPLVGLGKISYGVYIGHRLLMALWPALLRRLGVGSLSPWVSLLTLSALSVALATLSWLWIEKPILARKRWFPYEYPCNEREHPAPLLGWRETEASE